MVALRTLLAASGTAAVLSFSVALAQSTVPNIVGHWDKVEGSAANYTGAVSSDVPSTMEIEIAEQSGYAFNGTFSWTFPNQENPSAHDGSQHTHEAAEDVVGVFTGDGASFIIAEHPDAGMMFGRVLDDNRIEIVQVESGEFAHAARFIYERRQ